ncbi:MAG: nucleotidyltransferase domain-containing protein [Bauldia sp.]|nr:nucleotidyltransferase domain-containing protein [Bauldia sp.]
MGKILGERRESSNRRLGDLRKNLKETEKAIDKKACVYAVGSFGRQEAGYHSDLDLFIVSRVGKSLPDGRRPTLLKQLDEVCLKADLIKAARSLEFPEFSGDGRWLTHFTIDEIIGNIGLPRDDVDNTLTSQLLLLLESQCLIGIDAYNHIIDRTIQSYWRDFTNHENDFLPAFICNDILRLWRTFCVNYEANSRGTSAAVDTAKRRIKNYKLRQSRMLTCYSALLYLLRLYGARQTVAEDDFRRLVGLSPTQRLEWVADGLETNSSVYKNILDVINKYEEFLVASNESEKTLIASFSDESYAFDRRVQARAFGEALYRVLKEVGENGAAEKLYRLVVV